MEIKKQYTLEELAYALELSKIQGSILSEASDDLHDYGELVVRVMGSKTLRTAWEEDSSYHYLTELYQNTELVQLAIEEVRRGENMVHGLPYDYDITTMKDGREFIFFHRNVFTKESALQRAREVKEKMGYGDDFIYPTDNHVHTLWIKNNIYFYANPDSEYAYEYSNSTCKEAYLVIGVELIYK